MCLYKDNFYEGHRLHKETKHIMFLIGMILYGDNYLEIYFSIMLLFGSHFLEECDVSSVYLKRW